jgi:hypothetical protein
MGRLTINICFALAGVTCLLFVNSAPSRAGVLYETGFEAPAFTTGPIAGQNGWVNTFGNGGGVITTTNPASGSQALQIGGADIKDEGPSTGLSGSVYRPDLGVFQVDPAVTPTVYFQVDVRLDGRLIPYPSGTAADNGFANDLISANASVYDSSGNLLSELYVSSDGNIYGDNSTTNGPFGNGLYQITAAGGVGQYFTLGMLDDFSKLTSALYVNGSYVGSMAMPSPIAPGIRFDLQMLEVTGSLDPTRYAATFDNYEIAAVPEPSTFVMSSILFGIFGAVSACRHIRRRHSIC